VDKARSNHTMASIFYQIMRPLARIALSVNYRSIHLNGREHIPKGKPVILAANHPTAFVEPCILACWVNRPLHFLVRGDFFKKSFFRFLLESLHMIPVYRLKDAGYSGIKNNYESMKAVYKALEANKTIMILAEGSSIHEKRLRPLKKGTARLALGAALEQGLEEVYVVPVAVNYTAANKFQSDVMIDFGEPILATDYRDIYAEHPNKGITKMTADLRARMEAKIITIQDEADDELVNQLLDWQRNEVKIPIFPAIKRDDLLLSRELHLTSQFNQLADAQKADIQSLSTDYQQSIEAHELSDWGVVHGNKFSNFANALVLFLGALPAALGYVAHWLPFKIADTITKKKVNHVEFQSGVRLTIALVLTTILYLVFIFLGIRRPIIYLFLFLSAFLGMFWLIYHQKLQHFRASYQAGKTNEAIIQQLKEQRATLFAHFK